MTNRSSNLPMTAGNCRQNHYIIAKVHPLILPTYLGWNSGMRINKLAPVIFSNWCCTCTGHKIILNTCNNWISNEPNINSFLLKNQTQTYRPCMRQLLHEGLHQTMYYQTLYRHLQGDVENLQESQIRSVVSNP